MKTIAAGKFKDLCLQMLDEVAANRTPVVITKRGKPVAKLVPMTATTGRPRSLARSIIAESGDPYSTGDIWDADRP
jgi:prevent-host-death family protein